MQKIKVIGEEISYIELKLIKNPNNIPLFWRLYKEGRIRGMVTSYHLNKEGIAEINPDYVKKFGGVGDI